MFTATTLVSEPGKEIARGLREMMRNNFYSTSFSLNNSRRTDRQRTNTSLQRPSPGGGRRSWRVSRALVSCDCGQTASPPGPQDAGVSCSPKPSGRGQSSSAHKAIITERRRSSGPYGTRTAARLGLNLDGEQDTLQIQSCPQTTCPLPSFHSSSCK